MTAATLWRKLTTGVGIFLLWAAMLTAAAFGYELAFGAAIAILFGAVGLVAELDRAKDQGRNESWREVTGGALLIVGGIVVAVLWLIAWF